jgi:SAM-dependent methyltransferase
MDFKAFDKRHYPTLCARDGYARWAATYDETVPPLMDIRLLERIDSIEWSSVARAADLACGTGRTAAWMREKRVGTIDGVDLTPEMLDLARARGSHNSLHAGDIRETPLEAGAYGLIICSLADEHIPDLRPLYAEAARLGADEARFVLIGYHPFISMGGMPTHFDGEDGESIAIETHVHLLSDHHAAGRAAGWMLEEVHESVIDDEWIAERPRWEDRRGRPVSFALVWRTCVRLAGALAT